MREFFFFILVLFCIQLIKSIGDFIFYLLKINRTECYSFQFFESTFIGSLSVVIIYSTIATSFQTVMIGLTFFLVFYLKRKKDISKFELKEFKIPIKERLFFLLLNVFIPCVMFFSWQFYSVYDFQNDFLYCCNADLHTASFWVNDINKSGIERTAFPTVPNDFESNKSAYHYFEYWFVALIAQISDLNPLLIFKFIEVPAFCTFLYVGSIAIIDQISNRKNYSVKILSIGLIFFSQPIFLKSVVEKFSYYDHNLALNIGIMEPMLYKTLPLYLVVIFSFLLLVRNQPKEAFASLIILPVINIATLPSILAGYLVAFCSTIYYIIRNRENLKISPHFLLVLLTLVYIVGFYSFGNSMDEFSGIKKNFSLIGIINYYSNIPNLERGFFYILENLPELLESLIVLFLITFFGFKLTRKHHPLLNIRYIIVFFTIILASFSLFVIFSYSYDNFGFYRVIVLPFLNIACFFILIYFYLVTSGKLKYLFLIPLLFNISVNIKKSITEISDKKAFEQYKTDMEYNKKVISFLHKSESKNGISFHSEREISEKDFTFNQEYDLTLTNTSQQQRVTHDIYFPSMFIQMYFNDVRVFSVTKPVILNALIEGPKYSSFFEYYCFKNKLKIDNVSSKIHYKKYLKASFALATKQADFPNEMRAFVKDSAVNNITGDRFYLFK